MKKKQKWKAGRKRYSSKEGYDLYAPNYRKDWPFLDTFDKAVLFGMIGDVRGKRILDVGAGNGRLIEMLNQTGAEIVALDVSEEMLKNLQIKYPEVETVLGDIEELPFEDGSFDLVIATFLIVHLKSLGRAFEEIYRVLKDGGEFILTNINQRKPPRLKVDEMELVIDSYYHRPETVIEELEQVLFQIEEEEFVEDRGVWINQVLKVKK